MFYLFIYLRTFPFNFKLYINIVQWKRVKTEETINAFKDQEEEEAYQGSGFTLDQQLSKQQATICENG